LNFTHDVLAIIGSTRIGCHGIVVSPEDPPLGTFHRIILLAIATHILSLPHTGMPLSLALTPVLTK